MRGAADQPTPVRVYTVVGFSGAGWAEPAAPARPPQAGVAFSSVIACTADPRRTCCVTSLASAADPPPSHCSPTSNHWIGCSVACSSSRPRCTATAGCRLGSRRCCLAGRCYTQFLSKSITFLGRQGGCTADWPRSAGRDSRCRPCCQIIEQECACRPHCHSTATTLPSSNPLVYFSSAYSTY